MPTLVQQHWVMRDAVAKAVKFRHAHEVAARGVEGAVAAVTNLDAEVGAEPFCSINALAIGQGRHLWRRVAVDLRRIEHGVGAGKDAMTAIPLIGLVVVLTLIAAIVDFPEHDGCAMIATTHLLACCIPLLVGSPDAAGKAGAGCRSPERHRVDPPARLVRGDIDGARGAGAIMMPGHPELGGAGFDHSD